MSGFLDITRVTVPDEVAEETHTFIRRRGFQEVEAVALWIGQADGTTFTVQEALIPKQTALRTPTGLCYTVSPEELHRINVYLHESGMQIIAQLHSHPREAYHSELDDDLPIATTLGCLSLVIPDFAREPFSLKLCAIYRLLPGQGWAHMRPVEVARLIKIIGSDQLGTLPARRQEPSPPPIGTKRTSLWHWLHFLKRPR
jgi:proteasome lid subunit RPN8/RPN11